MNRHEQNKLTMFRATQAVLDSKSEFVESILPLKNRIVDFKQSIDEIQQRDNEYSGLTAGVTAAKNAAIDALINSEFFFANALYTFGRESGNEELKASCRMSMSDLTRLREGELEQLSSRHLQFAKTYAADLIAYGITDETISIFENALNAVRHQFDLLHNKFAESKAERELLYQAFEKTDEILREDIDRLMEMVKGKDIEFYDTYRAARTIKDYGTTHKKPEDDTGETNPPVPEKTLEGRS